MKAIADRLLIKDALFVFDLFFSESLPWSNQFIGYSLAVLFRQSSKGMRVVLMCMTKKIFLLVSNELIGSLFVSTGTSDSLTHFGQSLVRCSCCSKGYLASFKVCSESGGFEFCPAIIHVWPH